MFMSDGLESRPAASRVPSLYTIGVVAIITAIFLRSLGIEIDGDLWWHLGNGQRMFDLGALRIPEWMSFTVSGDGFVNQWWLGELGAWLLYRSFGMWSIFLASSAVIATSFVFVYLRMMVRGSSPSAAITMLTVGALASSVSWGTRPQIITMLLTSVFLWLLEHFDRTGSLKWLIPMPLLMPLWSNSHGGFVVGIALLVIGVLAAWFEGDGQKARWLGGALVAATLTSLIGPYGIRQWEYPLQFLVPNPWLNSIRESVSPDFHHPAFVPFEILLIVLIISAFWAPRRRWWDILLIVGFTHLALTQIRHIALWVIVIAPLVAEYSSAAIREIVARRPILARINSVPSTQTRAILNIALILAIAFFYVGVFSRVLMNMDFQRMEKRHYPSAAADYIAKAGLPERTFTTFEWGGYLAWRLHPQQKVFIDARADTIYDERLLMDYVTILKMLPGWRRQVDHWKIDQFVIERESDLDKALESDPSWLRAFADRRTVIFVRSQPDPAG
jgi:hypothetical protein